MKKKQILYFLLLSIAVIFNHANAGEGMVVFDTYITKIASGNGNSFYVTTSGGTGSCAGKDVIFYRNTLNSADTTIKDLAMNRAYANLQVAFSTTKKVSIWGSELTNCSSAFSVDVMSN